MTAPKGWPLPLPLRSKPQDRADLSCVERAQAGSASGVRRLLLAIGSITFAFALAAIALSFMIGVPLTVPTERISHAVGVHYLFPFAIGIAGYAFVQAVRLRFRPDPASRTVIRDNVKADAGFLILFVVVMYFHFHIKMWMPLVNPVLFDETYLAIDNWLRPLIEALAALRGWAALLLPEVDGWYQLGFLLMFALSLWFHAIGHRRHHFQTLTAILLMQMLGAFAYLIGPAVGPFIFENGANARATAAQQSMYALFRQVQEWGAPWLVRNGGEYFTGPPAAMPSLHIAGAWIMTHYALKARLAVAPFMVLMLVWIAVESVVSRWHYLIDLPAGLALAALAIVASDRLCRRFGVAPAPGTTRAFERNGPSLDRSGDGS